MTINEKILESKKSIKVPPFDFDKAWNKIEKRKENKTFWLRKKTVLILSACTAITATLLAVFIPINLVNNKTRVIEIGFDQDSGNGIVRPFESDLATMIKTDTKKENNKQLQIFYGNLYKGLWEYFSFSKEQTLLFTLYRENIDTNIDEIISKKEIYTMQEDISYFFSESFFWLSSSIIDTVSYEELLGISTNGSLLYTYTIRPLNDESFATIYFGES